jgi:hypothetical protein
MTRIVSSLSPFCLDDNKRQADLSHFFAAGNCTMPQASYRLFAALRLTGAAALARHRGLQPFQLGAVAYQLSGSREAKPLSAAGCCSAQGRNWAENGQQASNGKGAEGSGDSHGTVPFVIEARLIAPS